MLDPSGHGGLRLATLVVATEGGIKQNNQIDAHRATKNSWNDGAATRIRIGLLPHSGALEAEADSNLGLHPGMGEAGCHGRQACHEAM